MIIKLIVIYLFINENVILFSKVRNLIFIFKNVEKKLKRIFLLIAMFFYNWDMYVRMSVLTFITVSTYRLFRDVRIVQSISNFR